MRQAPNVKATKIVSVLVDDYVNIKNKPEINGVELVGKLDSKSLSLLSSRFEDYEKGTVGQLENSGYVVVLEEEGALKVPIKEFLLNSKPIETVTEVDPNTAIGSYLFVLKK